MAKLDIKIPNLTLPDGHEIPMLAYGTGTAWYKSASDAEDKNLIDSTTTAIKLGYTHLDCAESYNTHAEVGKAIKASGVPRSSLYITSKVSKSFDDIPGALETALKQLGTDHLDLYLVHEPFFAEGDKTKLQKAWADMEALQASGKVKSIGVSNFLRKDLDAILETAQTRPAINQIEFHPYLQHGDLLAYCKNKDIRISAYAPQTPATRAVGGPLDPKLDELARKYAVNPGEILLRWVVDMGIVAITTSGKEQRMSDYLRVCTFNLTPKELEDVKQIGDGHHFRAFFTKKFAPDDRS